MSALKRYRRREKTTVTAVQIDLETEGFNYRKWGGVQIARAGDWLVNNNGNVYTIDREAFEQTYTATGPGVYEKIGPVWAREAQADGQVKSTSGFSGYSAGDMIVFRDTDELDGWAMNAEEFNRLYEPDE